MSDEAAQRRARAEARRGRMILRKTTLSEGEIDLSPVWGEAAVSLVTELSETSWFFSGAPWPSYSRRQIPCRFVPWASK
jgi:hypothetical protein